MDEAAALLAGLKDSEKDRAREWARMGAFIAAMKGDAAGAAASVAPVLEDAKAGKARGEAGPARAVLALAGKHAELAASLEASEAEHELDDAGREALFRVDTVQKRFEDALRLALGEVWMDGGVLTPQDRWVAALTGLAGAAKAAGVTLKAPGDRPADAALVTLVTGGSKGGPAEGLAAFKVLTESPSAGVTLEALRGLRLAAVMAGDRAAETAANERLVAWLEPKRFSVWASRPRPTIKRLAWSAIGQMEHSGTAQLISAGGLARQIGELSGSMGGGEGERTYNGLWRAHAERGRLALAEKGDAAGLRALLKSQARAFGGSSGEEEDPYAQGYAAMMSLPSSVRAQYAQYYGRQGYGQRRSAGDADATLRDLLLRGGRYAELLAEYGALGDRTPETEGSLRAAVCAAGGKADEARALRVRAARAELAGMLAADGPDLASAFDPWAWYWGADTAGDRNVQSVRSALRVDLREPDEPDGERAVPVRGEPNQLWELALIDPGVESALLACEERVGLGWAGTRTVRELTGYYWAKKRPEQVVELLGKCVEPDKMLRSTAAGMYVKACFKAKDVARLETLLTQARAAGATLAADVDLARLMMLRHAGKGEEAGALESQLLARCVVETPCPLRVDPGLGVRRPWDPASWAAGRTRRWANSNSEYQGDQSDEGQVIQTNLRTAAELAEALGARYDQKVGPEDVTVREMREAYERHALWEHAARLVDQELAEAADPGEKADLLYHKAACLRKAGNAEGAAAAGREMEALVRAEAAKAPASAEPWWTLAGFYSSEAGGREWAKAYETLTAAKALDAGCDADGSMAVRCLYKLGRHAEAWAAWKGAQREGRAPLMDEQVVYYAGIAACRGGDVEAGRPLVRQALFRYPGSPLAAVAREVINERD